MTAVGCALAWNWPSLLFFRFVGGIGIGGASVPAAAFFFFLTPQSPRRLVARGRTREARAVLARMGSDPAAVETELKEIRSSLDLEHHTLAEPLFQSAYRRPILLMIAIAAFNQFSGINAVLYYGPAVFRMAGSGQDAALLQSVLVGGSNLVLTLLAMALIDRFGRRRLMLVGSIGYIVSLTATAWAFYRCGTSFDELQLHPLVHGGRDPVDVPDDRGGFGRPRLRLLRGDDGPPALLVLKVMPETKGVSLEEIQKRLGIA